MIQCSQVRGCLDRYFETVNMEVAQYNVTSVVTDLNGNLPLRSFVKNSMDLPYATTYDCPVRQFGL